MSASSCEHPPINVLLPSTNSVISDKLALFTSPSSLTVDDEQLTRTVHYTHDGKPITFEIVNKRTSLTDLDSSDGDADPISDNIFKRISIAIFRSCTSPKTRRVKAQTLGTTRTA